MRYRCLIALAAFASLTAHAQSSVTLYGILDAGITYADNENGSSKVRLGDGVNYGNRFGFRGAEDLGNGNQAIFNLEAGFNLKNGTSGQGGRMFGRQAWVGLKSNSLGSLTMGRQYDFVREYLQQFNYGGYAATYGGHQADFDRISGVQMDNSIKYMSPNVGGFSGGAMYALGEQPGSTSRKSALSLGGGYKGGPLSVGAAYVRLKDVAVYPWLQSGVFSFMGQPTATRVPGSSAVNDLYGFASGGFAVDKHEIRGIGASYAMNQWMFAANTTATKFTRGAASTTQRVYEIGALYILNPQWTFMGAYQHARLADDRWNQVTGGLQYNLSKRTAIHSSIAYLRASSNVNATQGAGFYLDPSSDNTQTTYRVALVHKF